MFNKPQSASKAQQKPQQSAAPSTKDSQAPPKSPGQTSQVGGGVVQQTIAALQSQIKELEKKNVELTAQNTQLSQQLENVDKQYQEESLALKQQNIKLNNDVEQMKMELRIYQENEGTMKQRSQEESMSRIAEKDTRITSLTEEAVRLKREAEDQKKQIFELSRRTKEQEAEILNQQDEIAKLQGDLESRDIQIDELQGHATDTAAKSLKVTKPLFIDDDQPEVFSVTQDSKTATGQAMIIKSKEVDKQRIQFAFREAERTITDLQEQNRSLKNDLVAVKREVEQIKTEKKADADAQNIELQDKAAEIEFLQQELDNQKLSTTQQEAKKVIKQQVETHPTMNFADVAGPMPVYHSIVNPTSRKSVREEYSLMKQQVAVLEMENQMLKRKIERLEEIEVAFAKGKLYPQLNSPSESKQMSQTFNMLDLKNQLAEATVKIPARASMMETLKQKSSLYKTQMSQLSHMEGDESALTKQMQKVSQEIFGEKQIALSPGNEMKATQPGSVYPQPGPNVVQGIDQQDRSDVSAYLDDLPNDVLKQEFKQMLNNINEIEEENKQLRLIQVQYEIMESGLKKLQSDYDQLSVVNIQQQSQAQKEVVVEKMESKDKNEKRKVAMAEKGSQCQIYREIEKMSKETQTRSFQSTGRLKPVLISVDGIEYEMDTDKTFQVLVPPKNGISKKFKVQQNIITDEQDKKVDFNGTYKDSRGVFAVVHGLIDKTPQESQFEAVPNEGQQQQQLYLYKKELLRIEAENVSLSEALATTRTKLARVTNKTIQEIVLDDQPEVMVRTVNNYAQTDGLAATQQQQFQSSTNIPAGDQVAQFIGQCLGAMASSQGYSKTQSSLQNVKITRDQTIATEENQINALNQVTRTTRCTSPTRPEYHQLVMQEETEKEVQTDLYVVPMDSFLLEKERSNQFSKENSRLIIQIQKQRQLQQQFDQKQKELQLAVAHIAELNDGHSELERQNSVLKQQIIGLQGEMSTIAANKAQFSDVFTLTNIQHQELFDQLRQRIAQKDAQIGDLQQLLSRARDDASKQIALLAEQLEGFHRTSDALHAAKDISALKEAALAEGQAATAVAGGRLSISEQQLKQLEAELEALKRHCAKLEKAGQVIKAAFVQEQNKNTALAEVGKRLRAAVGQMCVHNGYHEIQIYVARDDTLDQLEPMLRARISGE